MDKYTQYTEVSYSGSRLLKKHKLSQVSTWKILGEDLNCDLSGPHHRPDLGIYYGTLEETIKYAVNLKGFWSWGGGGSIIMTPGDEDVAKFINDGVRVKALAKLTSEEKKVLGLE